MLETVATALSWILIGAGSFFVVVGATGIVRMPDVFTRMHAAGILDTVGAGLMLIGMMFAAGLTLVSLKLLIILAIILFTSPVATHALAQAAMHAGLEPVLESKRVLGVPEQKSARKRKAPAKRTRAPAKAAATAKTKASTKTEPAETGAGAAKSNPSAKTQSATRERAPSKRSTDARSSASKGRGEPSNS